MPKTLTLLFTDIEGSTQLLRSLGGGYARLLEEHHGILRRWIESHGGAEFGIEGDALFARFDSAISAVLAAVDSQSELQARLGKAAVQLRVRMAIHSGELEESAVGLVGMPLHEAARLCSVAYGEQVVISEATFHLVRGHVPNDLAFLDLGEVELRDIPSPFRLFQLAHPRLRSDFPPPRARTLAAEAMPIRAGALVGRVEELTQLRREVTPGKLLTIVGPAGVGKTTLAVAATSGLVASFRHGSHFVDLASVRDADGVRRAVLTSLGRSDLVDAKPREALRTVLGSRETLLILDNCEHVVQAVGDLVDVIVSVASAVALVATSRVPLRVDAEEVMRLAPLAVPPNASGAHATGQYESVRLFAERARQAARQFAVTDVNVTAVGEICRRLDGLPLAIELAAARVSAFSAEQIANRLDQRFQLFEGTRTRLPHHRTLGAALDWSYELLSDIERQALCRLALFRSSFTLEAAEAVVGPQEPQSTAAVVASLVDHSLLATLDGAVRRFAMLETVREYAAQHLRATPNQLAAAGSNLVAWLRSQFSPEQARDLSQQDWLRRVDVEHENILSALDWADESECWAADAAHLASSLADYWLARGQLREGIARLTSALGASAPSGLRARILLQNAGLLMRGGDIDLAFQTASASLQLFETIEDLEGQLEATTDLAVMAQLSGRSAQAQVLQERVLSAENLPETLKGKVFFNAGLILHDHDGRAAEAYYRRALPYLRASKDARAVAKALGNLGLLAHEHGDLELADKRYRQVLELFTELADKVGLAVAFINLGELAHYRGEHAEARTLMESGLSLALEAGDTRTAAAGYSGLAMLAQETGDTYRAAESLIDALRLEAETEDRSLAVHMYEAAAVLVEVDSDDADRVFRAAEAICGSGPFELPVSIRERIATTRPRIRSDDGAESAGKHDPPTRSEAAALTIACLERVLGRSHPEVLPQF